MIKNSKRRENPVDVIRDVLRAEEKAIEHRSGDFTTVEEVSDAYDEILSTEGILASELFPNLQLDYDFEVGIDEKYWIRIVEDNNRQNADEGSLFEDYDERYYRDDRSERVSEDRAIDELFSKSD